MRAEATFHPFLRGEWLSSGRPKKKIDGIFGDHELENLYQEV